MKLYVLNENIISGLKEAGIKEAELEAFYIIEHVLGFSRSAFFLKKQDEVEEALVNKCLEIAKIRESRMPLQYILGKQEFMGLTFRVTENVLIPRQETEGLVEEILKVLKPGMKVLDMCTGSGCIAISLKKYAGEIQVTAVDISPEALKIAKENAKSNQTEISFVESDMFEQVAEKYDVIVSNPPYIKSDVIDTLMAEVKNYEPRLALDGFEDGLYFYRKLAREAGNYLNPGGMLCLEIGHDQGAEVATLLKENSFTEVRVEKDLCGLERNVYGKIGGSHV